VLKKLSFLVFAAHFLFASAPSVLAQAPEPILGVGDVVVSGFAGTRPNDLPEPMPPGLSPVDFTFIDPDGISARIFDAARPDYVWDGRLFDAPEKLALPAKIVGQVFGVAIDDEPAPNVYLAATSAFGLNIVARRSDGTLERRKIGGPGTGWMPGQFGLDLLGGPGSIYKVDGVTGDVTLFAEVMLDGAANPGPSLGNLAYDPEHRQLLVSDLYTGMVHRFAIVDGAELGLPYDHGTAGRQTAGLPPVPFDPSGRPNIASPRFNAEDPATWNYAPAARRVWGLAVHQGRLFYSVGDESDGMLPQIWSVGLLEDGSVAEDPRWELDIPVEAGPYAVSDIVFSEQGAMILAQRAPVAGAYDYVALTAPGEPRVLRFWLESPDDPATPSRWIEEPEEYAVGFAGNYRNTNGGVDLGYGYDERGELNQSACEYALWTTGQQLRNDPALIEWLQPGGPLAVNGLQASPSGPVRGFNTPPGTSYFVDYDRREDEPGIVGHLGGVRVLRAPCAPSVASYPDEPPYLYVDGDSWIPEPPVEVIDACPWQLNEDGSCGLVSVECPWGYAPDGWCGPVVPDCSTAQDDKTCGATKIDLALKKRARKPVFDEKTGLWTVDFKLRVTNKGDAFQPGSSIAVHEAVPPGLTFIGASGANWSCAPALPLSSGSLNCSYAYGGGMFATGQTLNALTISATFEKAGEYENCATVGVAPRSGLRETTRKNNKACAVVEAEVEVDVAIEKTGKVVPVEDMPPAGITRLSFDLTPTNVGPAFTGANAITVSDIVPAGMTFIAVSGAPDWTCTAAPIAAGGTMACTYVGSGPAAPGAVLGTISITATSDKPGPWENCASVAVTPAAGTETKLDDNKSCAEVGGGVDISIEKTGTAVAIMNSPVTGQTALTFTLTATNVGPAFTGANAITVTDTVPTGMTFTSVSGAPDWTCGTTPIAAGGTLSCTYTGAGPTAPGAALGAITITATTAAAGPWENCAGIAASSSAGSETNLDDNQACVTVEAEDDFDEPDDPPPVANACGTNVIFVVDESGSVGPYSGNVQSALNNAAALFNTHGSQAAMVHFSDGAQVVMPMASSTYGSISSGYSPVGGTNWEAGLTAALGLVSGAPPNTIVVFITDGEPNAALDPSGTTFYTDSVTATNEAITVVNQIYAAGVPVIGIGVGSFSTHLNALLGGNVQMTSFSALNGALTGLARDLCPGVYLTKSISPRYINLHYNPIDEVTVTLTVTNTAGALSNLVVEDDLLSQFTPLAILSATPPTSAVLGDPVVWTIPSLAAGGTAGDTATLSFKVKVTPSAPVPTDGSWLCMNNFAQVTAVGTGTVGNTPNNMANAETGPVHEPDEASSSVCLQDRENVIVPGCTDPRLWVKKTSLAEVCRPGEGGPPCSFNVTVTAQCAAFDGPVLFGDGVFSGSTSVPMPIASVTSTPPVSCVWSTSTPGTCLVPNLALPLGQSITFAVTLGAPIPAGTYRNCFVADGTAPVASDFTTAYGSINPGSSTSGGLWGHCAAFVVAPPVAPLIPVVTTCKSGQTFVAGRGCVSPPKTTAECRRPMVQNAKGACECPEGTRLRGGKCVKVEACARPMVLNPKGACECPAGTRLRGGKCVKAEACARPMAMNAKGACECPAGTRLRGGKCQKVEAACARPMVMNAKGACECPAGTRLRGGKCQKVEAACARPMVLNAKGACECPRGTRQRGGKCEKVQACARPMVLNAKGACECPAGTTQRGGKCIQPDSKPKPVKCRAPAFLNQAGTQCLCPEGLQAKGGRCVEGRRPPAEKDKNRNKSSNGKTSG
jgi:uncharacterized repeat protein (TIGR01451 family)